MSMAERKSLHPLLALRTSPAAFDHAHELSRDDVEALLNAARWAPSAGNSQPWAFIVALRGDLPHQELVVHLAASSGRWAPYASALIVNLAHVHVEGTDWQFSDFSRYDLGQAVAYMTFQAAALGLAIRQFRAFDQQGIATAFDVPAHWEVTSMSAIGRPLSDSSASRSRTRRSIEDVVWKR